MIEPRFPSILAVLRDWLAFDNAKKINRNRTTASHRFQTEKVFADQINLFVQSRSCERCVGVLQPDRIRNGL
jgi:hypothetical protein